MATTQQNQNLRMRLGKVYGLSPQLTKFLALLITMECVSPTAVGETIGNVQASVLATQLRKRLRAHVPGFEIRNIRGFGYWISDDAKRFFATRPIFKLLVENDINTRALGLEPNGDTDDETYA